MDAGNKRWVEGADSSGLSFEMRAGGRDSSQQIDGDFTAVVLVPCVEYPSLRELDPASINEESAP